MRRWVKSLPLDAALKTIVVLLVIHVVLLIVGAWLGPMGSVFGIRMFWPHLEIGFWNFLISVILALVVYAIIYFAMSGSTKDE